MFRKVCSIALTALLAVSGATGVSAAGAVNKLTLVEGGDMGTLTPEQSAIIVLPNETIISIHNQETRATLAASRLSADGRTAESTPLFASGNTEGQNPSRFDWVIDKAGKLTVVYTTWLQESGKFRAGMSARSTTDGSSWSAAVQVLPTFDADLGCEPLTEVCGYVQPHLIQAPTGKLLLVAAKTNLLNTGSSVSTASLVSTTSTDGTKWAPAANFAALPAMGGTPSEAKKAYASKGFFSVAATADSFVVLYPYLSKFENVFRPADTGYKSASQLYKDSQWQAPKVVNLVSGLKWSTDGGALQMGPFLVNTSNKLLALWFEQRQEDGTSILREAIWNPAKGSWGPRTDIYKCSECFIYNTAPTDKNVFVVSGSKVILPFVESTYDGQSNLVSVKYLSIVDGKVANGVAGSTVATSNPDLGLGAAFFGIHLGSDGTSTFVIRRDLEAEVVEVSADGQSKVAKSIDALWPQERFVTSSNVVHSFQLPNGNLSLMTQQYRLQGNPAGTVFSYYQLIRATPPVFSGRFAISGTAKVASTIKVPAVTFTSSYGASATTYKWYRCTKQVKVAPVAKPSYCTAIPKATTTSYKMTSKDKGQYLITSAESFNSGGTTSIFTISTGLVK